MFFATAQVGSLFAVYDDSDGTVEWFNKEQISAFLKKGVEIYGITPQGFKPIGSIQVPFSKCNWTKSRNNIFQVATSVKKNKDILVIIAENKKYKCKILDRNNTVFYVVFTNGLNVQIPVDWLERYI